MKYSFLVALSRMNRIFKSTICPRTGPFCIFGLQKWCHFHRRASGENPHGRRSSRKPLRRPLPRELRAFFSCMAWRAPARAGGSSWAFRHTLITLPWSMYVLLWRKCTRPNALKLQTSLWCLLLCFPKGKVLPSYGGEAGLPLEAAVLAQGHSSAFSRGAGSLRKPLDLFLEVPPIFSSLLPSIF